MKRLPLLKLAFLLMLLILWIGPAFPAYALRPTGLEEANPSVKKEVTNALNPSAGMEEDKEESTEKKAGWLREIVQRVIQIAQGKGAQESTSSGGSGIAMSRRRFLQITSTVASSMGVKPSAVLGQLLLPEEVTVPTDSLSTLLISYLTPGRLKFLSLTGGKLGRLSKLRRADPSDDVIENEFCVLVNTFSDYYRHDPQFTTAPNPDELQQLARFFKPEQEIPTTIRGLELKHAFKEALQRRQNNMHAFSKIPGIGKSLSEYIGSRHDISSEQLQQNPRLLDHCFTMIGNLFEEALDTRGEYLEVPKFLKGYAATILPRILKEGPEFLRRDRWYLLHRRTRELQTRLFDLGKVNTSQAQAESIKVKRELGKIRMTLKELRADPFPEKRVNQAIQEARGLMSNLHPRVPPGAIFIVLMPPPMDIQSREFIDDYALIEHAVKVQPALQGVTLIRYQLLPGEYGLERARAVAQEFNIAGTQPTVGIALGVLPEEVVRTLYDIWPNVLHTTDPLLALSFIYTPEEALDDSHRHGQFLTPSLSSQFVAWASDPVPGLMRVLPGLTLPPELWQRFEGSLKSRAGLEQAV